MGVVILRAALSKFLLVPVLLLLFLSSCKGGSQGAPEGLSAIAPPEAPELLSIAFSGGNQRGTSGLPRGIILTFTRVDHPWVDGYYVYRDTQPITFADPAKRVRFDGEELVPQPGSGNTVEVLDLFEGSVIEIPETYYYRVSSVDIFGSEGALSDEQSITTSTFNPGDPEPAAGYWGDTVDIRGDDYGEFVALTDRVRFRTGQGEMIEAKITNWQTYKITVEVPHWAVSGNIQIEVAGTLAETDSPFEVLNPHISSILPDHGVGSDHLVIFGGNLGEGEWGDKVFFPPLRIVSQEYTLSWSETEILLLVPSRVGVGDLFLQIGGEYTNRIFFRGHPFIDDLDYPGGRPGQEIAISGRNFGDTRGVSRIVFANGAEPAEYPEWKKNLIRFIVPEGVESGDALVWVEGNSSNPVVFDAWLELSPAFSALEPGDLVIGAFNFSLLEEPDVELVEWFIYPFGEEMPPEPYFTSDAPPSDFSGETPELLGMFNAHYQITARAHRRDETAEASADAYVVTLIGDLNGDGIVDEGDIAVIEAEYGDRADDEDGYNPLHDADGSGIIDEADVSMIGYHYGETSA